MGKFFNDFIKGMPNSTIRKLKGSTKVSENRIYGQTKGFLEEERKNFSGEDKLTITRQETPIDLLRKQRYENLVKAREAKRLKAERLKSECTPQEKDG